MQRRRTLQAQVRYFCTNHEPGIWLTGPTCPQCAARSAHAPVATKRAEARPSAVATEVGAARRRPERPRPIDESALEPRPERPSLWDALLRVGAPLAPRDPAPVSRAGGWLKQLVFRLAVIALVLGIGVAVAIYWVVHSLH